MSVQFSDIGVMAAVSRNGGGDVYLDFDIITSSEHAVADSQVVLQWRVSGQGDWNSTQADHAYDYGNGNHIWSVVVSTNGAADAVYECQAVLQVGSQTYTDDNGGDGYCLSGLDALTVAYTVYALAGQVQQRHLAGYVVAAVPLAGVAAQPYDQVVGNVYYRALGQEDWQSTLLTRISSSGASLYTWFSNDVVQADTTYEYYLEYLYGAVDDNGQLLYQVTVPALAAEAAPAEPQAAADLTLPSIQVLALNNEVTVPGIQNPGILADIWINPSFADQDPVVSLLYRLQGSEGDWSTQYQLYGPNRYANDATVWSAMFGPGENGPFEIKAQVVVNGQTYTDDNDGAYYILSCDPDGGHQVVTTVCEYYVGMPVPDVESEQGYSCMAGFIYSPQMLPVDENDCVGTAYYRVAGLSQWQSSSIQYFNNCYQYGHNGGDALDMQEYEVKIEFLYGQVDDNSGQFYRLDLRAK